jgi:predicted O-methyltransferase YrrM
LAAGVAAGLLLIGWLLSKWMGTGSLLVLTSMGFALLALIALDIYRRLQRQINLVEKTASQAEGLITVFSVLDFDKPLPSLGDSAISPDLAHLILLTMFEERPHRILELGPGISTLLLAKCAQRLGEVRIWSVEHEATFVDLARSRLELHGLGGQVELIHAPLTDISVAGKRMRWYDSSFLSRIDYVDFLLVDGPPSGDQGPMLRYPALPVLYPLLSPGAVILVDDAARSAEKNAVEMWLREFPEFRCAWLDTQKGTAILRRLR